MAIYHASFQIIKRSSGRSATAASAYRSGTRIVDERTGEIHDYTKRSGVDATLIMLPEGAPSWMYQRDELWNAVELQEKRKDAQLSRELNLALPIELSAGQSRELVREYAQSAFVKRGMVVDIAMHDVDGKNPHAHIMLTMRDIEGDGFGKKNRDWNDRKLLESWREEWAERTNRKLARHDHEERIDHRSYERQGSARVPTRHMGPKASAMEARGIKTERGDRNRMILALQRELTVINAKISNLANSARLAATQASDRMRSILMATKKEDEERERSERERESRKDGELKRNPILASIHEHKKIFRVTEREVKENRKDSRLEKNPILAAIREHEKMFEELARESDEEKREHEELYRINRERDESASIGEYPDDLRAYEEMRDAEIKVAKKAEEEQPKQEKAPPPPSRGRSR